MQATVNDSTKLQESLDLITVWASDWQLQVYQLKMLHTCWLCVGSCPVTCTYDVGASVISNNTQCTDVGITVTSNLSPSLHHG